MARNKKRQRVRALNNYEFEKFVRTNLAADLADVILLTMGIRSYNGFLQSHDLNAELLYVYNLINEKNKLNLFLSHNTSSSSSPTNQVKPAILRELKLFQDECKKRMNNDSNEINSENSSSTQYESDPKKIKKTLKYLSIENEATDWSFDNEEALDYDLQFHDLSTPQNLIIKEATHTYVMTQKINHFFEKNMKIKPQGKVTSDLLTWHIENLYEFTMKTRTNSTLYNQFVEDFRDYGSKKDIDLKQKNRWLVDYIKKIKYKPSGYGH
ncbi:unnamed protein product [Rotaria magnacalcarata]|uniref:Uncharacterized protein n=1 Tax=Rotaria magnacalcarata TaxID=392030 RepID=A0A819KY23_9BILA|nr:unnamed protein product [Rotaria magnacalcarata]CAF3956947.1 unnamed protein product [Rotaria magnacalcarata]